MVSVSNGVKTNGVDVERVRSSEVGPGWTSEGKRMEG